MRDAKVAQTGNTTLVSCEEQQRHAPQGADLVTAQAEPIPTKISNTRQTSKNRHVHKVTSSNMKTRRAPGDYAPPYANSSTSKAYGHQAHHLKMEAITKPHMARNRHISETPIPIRSKVRKKNMRISHHRQPPHSVRYLAVPCDLSAMPNVPIGGAT